MIMAAPKFQVKPAAKFSTSTGGGESAGRR